MYKVVFKINKFGDQKADREISIISLELNLEYRSKNKILLPDIDNYFIIGDEKFIIKEKINSIESFEDDICYVNIVYLELPRLKPILKPILKPRITPKAKYDDDFFDFFK